MLNKALAGRSLMVLTCLLSACGSDPVPVADRVFINGGVYTVDDQRSWAEAVAIRDGAIVFVGSNDEVSAYIGDSTIVADLSSKMLLPGFHDGHAHVLDGGRSLNSCNLQNSNDAEHIRDLLTGCRESRNYGPDEWVVGAQWPISAFGPEGPSRLMLDEIFGGRPAAFVDSFWHNSWVSTRALELAGINADTPNPPGGIIVRDPVSGVATGTLRESAMALVADIIPPPTDEEQAANLATGLAEAAKFGITAYIEPGIRGSELKPYLVADRNGTLSARVLASLSPIGFTIGAFGSDVYDLVARRDSFAGNYLDTDSVKVFMDGVIETKTANMLEPYSDDQSNADTFYEQAVANELYQKLDGMGVQIHTHAIGDGAVRTALNAYEYALQQNGPNDNRHQIVHLQLIDAADIPRFAELNVAANFQALWAYPDQYILLAAPIVGQGRVDNFYALKSIVDTGATLVGGSDWPVSSLNPLDAIEVAVRRQDPTDAEGAVHRASERVDLPVIIDAYTRNGAWLMRIDDKTGTIEPGKRADLIVLDRNLFDIPFEQINTAKVLMTLMDGKEVYRVD
jgi:predicted amidohydrolase YtcJ